MKIDSTTPILTGDKVGKKGASDTNATDFAQALARISEGASAERSSGAGNASDLTSVTGALLAAKSSPAAQVDQAVSALEKYAKALADPGQTLKQIEPLVDDLEVQSEGLSNLSGGLADGHPLKALAEETGLLMQVEAAKFRRGDFV